MKTLKTLCILFLSVLIISCSKDDDGDGGSAGEPEFKATINGGSFSNYNAVLGSYSITTNVGLTIAVTDANANVIRIFMNETGGMDSGVTKEVGNVDTNGFATNVIIRDQASNLTYTSSAGSIKITENRNDPESEGTRLISGTFNITANDNIGTVVTMTGSFKNLIYTSL